MKKPIVGKKIKTWFSDKPDGFSTVIAVKKYTGRYSNDFKWVVTLSAPRCNAGQIETAL